MTTGTSTAKVTVLLDSTNTAADQQQTGSKSLTTSAAHKYQSTVQQQQQHQQQSSHSLTLHREYIRVDNNDGACDQKEISQNLDVF